MGHLLDWYTDPEKFQGEVNLKVIKFIDEITNFPDRISMSQVSRSNWCISPEYTPNFTTKNLWSHAKRVAPFFMDLRARDETHTDSVVINHKT